MEGGKGEVPGDNLAGTSSYGEETEEGKDHRYAEAPDWHAFLRALS